VEGSASVRRTKWETCHVWEEKRGPLAFSSVPLHCNPDFPMFDHFSLCRFKSVARLVTNTSLLQPCRTFLLYSITVTQIQHKAEKSKQTMINSILNLFAYLKNRMQLNPPQLHPSLEVTWVANKAFSFHPNHCCFPVGTKGCLKFSRSEKLLLSEKLHPIQRGPTLPQNSRWVRISTHLTDAYAQIPKI